MKTEAQRKAQKTKEENERKLFNFLDWEIKKDAMQFIAKSERVTWYYPTLTALFRDLRTVHTDHKIDSNIKLPELVENLEKRDKEFIKELTQALKGLPEALR